MRECEPVQASCQGQRPTSWWSGRRGAQKVTLKLRLSSERMLRRGRTASRVKSSGSTPGGGWGWGAEGEGLG